MSQMLRKVGHCFSKPGPWTSSSISTTLAFCEKCENLGSTPDPLNQKPKGGACDVCLNNPPRQRQRTLVGDHGVVVRSRGSEAKSKSSLSHYVTREESVPRFPNLKIGDNKASSIPSYDCGGGELRHMQHLKTQLACLRILDASHQSGCCFPIIQMRRLRLREAHNWSKCLRAHV